MDFILSRRFGRTRRCLGTLIGALLLTIIFWGGVSYIASRNSVSVDKIAPVKFLSELEAEKYHSSAIPISQISDMADANKSAVLTGWAADVKDVCRGGLQVPGGQVILLTPQGSGFVAVRTGLTPRTCDILTGGSAGSRPVWAVADNQFMGVESKPAYIFLDQSNSFDNSMLRLH